MWFHLTAVDPQNQSKKFSFYINQLEQGLNILNRLVVSGEKLISVQLVQEQSVTHLPVESFDGTSLLEQIQRLERVWKTILEKPNPSVKGSQPAILVLVYQQLLVCENKISRIEPLLIRVEALLANCQKMSIALDAKQMLEINYQYTLNLYQRQLNRAYLTRQRLQQSIQGFY